MSQISFDPSVFKAYDVRGVVGETLTEQVAYLTGRALAACAQAKTVATGRDVRESSLALQHALNKGLTEGGADVLDIGLCGTEEVNFITADKNLDAGVMVTASHNPMEYNGLKIIGQAAHSLKSPYDLPNLRDWVAANFDTLPTPAAHIGTLIETDNRAAYVQKLTTLVSPSSLKPKNIVVNSGNGCANVAFEPLKELLTGTGATFTEINMAPDGTFPNGIPNPLLPENRAVTSAAVTEHNADFGVAWDGDFDRCFLFDEQGTFVPPAQLGALLAQHFLTQSPKATILHDPRQEWNMRSVVEANNGTALRVRCGYSFFKTAQRQHKGAFGAEASGHFFFKDFGYCDSGMLPWLFVWQILSHTDKPLSQLLKEANTAAVACDETNLHLSQPAANVLAKLEADFGAVAQDVDKTDGLSLTFDDWRCNIRASNTEPLLRVNVEARTAETAQAEHGKLIALIQEL